MNFTPADDFVDEVWGKVGTPERDKMEEQVKEEVNTYLLGEAIKKERINQNLTQEELGERVNIQIGEWKERYNSTNNKQSIQGSWL